MADMDFTIVRQRLTPLMQLVVALIVGWAGMLISKFTHQEVSTPYFAAFIGIIFFTIMNTVVSLANPSFVKYTVVSYGVYILLLALLLLSAKFVSGISIWDLWIYRMMTTSVTMFYVIVSILIRAVRFLFDIAQEDF
ncbi:MAG: hypothetical protein U0T75_06375 [Chitinophagales bacterium]